MPPAWYMPIFKMLISNVVGEGVSAFIQLFRDSMSSGQVVFQFPVENAKAAYLRIQSFLVIYNTKAYTISKDEEMMTFCFPGAMKNEYRAFFSNLIKED